MASLQTGMSLEEESGKQLSIITHASIPIRESSPSPSTSPIQKSSISPSKPNTLETPIASHPFDYPSPSPPPMQPLPNLPSIESVHTRGASLASNASSVKRKPLPINAKPLALRCSTDESSFESSRDSFETPGPRFYRNPSIDSPTLWEAGLFDRSDNHRGPQPRQRSPT